MDQRAKGEEIERPSLRNAESVQHDSSRTNVPLSAHASLLPSGCCQLL